MNARELAEKHGVSHTLIYNMAKKLGRLPTDEEIENRNRKTGRPQKYRSIEDENGKELLQVSEQKGSLSR